MKKILLLGGSAQQVVAIETAKKLGLHTILCDYLPDNPGQYVADTFYLASTTDKDLILDIAKKEQIDGIVAYASDPAAPTAAYVAEQLHLPGNPLDSVEILCNKDQFRKFLADNGFHTPMARAYTTTSSALYDLVVSPKFTFPVIVKPVDSSGSKGVMVLKNQEYMEEGLLNAFRFSRSKKIVVEEFIEKKHDYLVGGDIFIQDGKIVLWGLLNCHRDPEVNELVPVGKSYPLRLGQEDIQKVKAALQDLVSKLHIQSGAMNVELILDANNQVWFVDVGPRNGGNMIPDLLGYIFNVDVVELTIKAAMGMDFEINSTEDSSHFYATHNLHSAHKGLFESIKFSKEIEPFIFRKNIYKKFGDEVEFFDHAAKALGIIFLKFNTQEEMNVILDHIHDHIQIKLDEGSEFDE